MGTFSLIASRKNPPCPQLAFGLLLASRDVSECISVVGPSSLCYFVMADLEINIVLKGKFDLVNPHMPDFFHVKGSQK